MSTMPNDHKPCAECGTAVHPYDVFPHANGIQCLDCYAVSQEGQRMPTASELARMWGGK